VTLSREQIAKLQQLLEAEVAAEEERNPRLDCHLVRHWLNQQLDKLDIHGWRAFPESPPLEPQANADQQDEMDALDEIWRRTIARMRVEYPQS
jgi:hypothetical protein